MKPKNRLTTIIRWIATILGSASLIILLFIVGADL
jgi:hypothetical protein